jgi:hypoxanthine phosphoribosyltransferase
MVSLRELLGLNLQIYLFQSPGDVENENRDLAQKIKNSRPDYDPDIIAGALRGGLWALRIFLDNYFQKAAASKDYEVVNLSFYGEVNQPVTFLLKRGLSSDVADKELLWVEDLSDTGLSFLKLLHHTYEKGLEEKKRSNCFSEERYQYLTGRLNELKRILDEKDGKAAREFRESGFMKDFEDIVHVTTAAAYVKADTAFIPNFFNRMVSSSCWIASSYEGQ